MFERIRIKIKLRLSSRDRGLLNEIPSIRQSLIRARANSNREIRLRSCLCCRCASRKQVIAYDTTRWFDGAYRVANAISCTDFELFRCSPLSLSPLSLSLSLSFSPPFPYLPWLWMSHLLDVRMPSRRRARGKWIEYRGIQYLPFALQSSPFLSALPWTSLDVLYTYLHIWKSVAVTKRQSANG